MLLMVAKGQSTRKGTEPSGPELADAALFLLPGGGQQASREIFQPGVSVWLAPHEDLSCI